MAEPSVSAGLARGLLELAVAKGADRETLMARAGIDAAAFHDQDNRVPYEKYVALMRAGKEMACDPALALHFGEAYNLSEISVVGLIGQASAHMIDALQQLNRYVRLVVDVDLGAEDRFQLRRDHAGLWMADTRSNPNDFPELTESAFAQFVGGARRFGLTPKLKAVHVTHPRPAHHAEYDRVFEAPTTFDSDENAVLVEEAWMTDKIAQLPRYVFGVLSEHADALLKELEDSKTMRGRVEGELLPVLHRGDISMDTVAANLGVSRQTLYRSLKIEGVTFERVLDDLRHKLALHYLSGRRVSVNETAYLVGFSDRAAFSRAFKRWTGMSPGQYRGANGAP